MTARVNTTEENIIESMHDVLDALLGRLDWRNGDMGKTPERVAKYLMEYHQRGNLAITLGEPFPNRDGRDGEIDAMIVQTDIPFRGMCAHHLLPFFGTADIGYIPKKKIVGLSKLARLTHAAGVYEPSIQEVITDNIAQTLEKVLEPMGVMVVVRAEHTCMTTRGIAAPGVKTTTSSLRGVFLNVASAREEFLALTRR